jgi:hypothetical protein
MMAIVASKLWARTDTPAWYRGEVSRDHAHECEHDIAFVWKWLAQPLLFGVIGTAVNFRQLSPSTIPKSLLVVAVGVAVRSPLHRPLCVGLAHPYIYDLRYTVYMRCIYGKPGSRP